MDFSQAAAHLNWLAILVAPLAGVAIGVTYLFEARPFSLFAINAGYQTVLFAAMDAVPGAWR